MKIKRVSTAYFSPTGTSGRVARAVAQGMGQADTRFVDVTCPEAREQPLRLSGDELLVVAVPVYMGRVPALLEGWLGAIQAEKTPAVCLVVYGNRAYEDALLELKDVLASRGCVPVAGAAFIGEHSFSTPETPVAQGRPDKDDLRLAREFGERISEKLGSASSVDRIPDLTVPGSTPYGGLTKLWDVDFIEVSDDCSHCGLCAEICPMGAVDPHDSALIDLEKCITCCACIKRCPQAARSMKPGPVKDASMRLHTLHGEPKQPEFFL